MPRYIPIGSISARSATPLPLSSSAKTKVRFNELNINEGANVLVNRIESKSTTCSSRILPCNSGVRTVGQIPEVVIYIHLNI